MSEAANRPRNHLVVDATTPYTYSFVQYGKQTSIVVDQTPEEDTWPGGALWDIGVLLSHGLVGIAGAVPIGAKKIEKLPSRLMDAFPSTKDLTVLELGCGVGLTGLVAAAVLGTKLTILTDLKVVVDKVTEPNLLKNSERSTGKHPYRTIKQGKRGRVLAMPLCWGDGEDEQAVSEAFQTMAPASKSTRKVGKGKKPVKSTDAHFKPDIILIGDVAYQHKPGAPSHFDILLSTLLKFLGDDTYVIFGTRMRMPASADLLEMFLKHLEAAVVPIQADEIDPSFGQFKHQIAIHILRKKKKG